MATMEAPAVGPAHAGAPALGAVRAHYYSVAQAARELAVSDRVVRKLAAGGILDGEVLEGRWLVTRASVVRERDRRRQDGRTRRGGPALGTDPR